MPKNKTSLQMPKNKTSLQMPGCKCPKTKHLYKTSLQMPEGKTSLQMPKNKTSLQIPCHSANTRIQIPPEKVTRQSHKTKPMDKTIRQNDKTTKNKISNIKYTKCSPKQSIRESI
jgi:hypothetical protein